MADLDTKSGEILGNSYVALTDDEISGIAKGIHNNTIFTSMQIPAHSKNLVQQIFMPLLLMDIVQGKQMAIDEIVELYSEMADAGPMGVNGFPIFTAMRMLNEEDAIKIIAKHTEIEKVLKEL